MNKTLPTKTKKWYKNGLLTGLITFAIFIISDILLTTAGAKLGSGQGALVIVIAPLFLIWLMAGVFTIYCLIMTIKAHPSKHIQYFYASLGIVLVLSPIWLSLFFVFANDFWSSHFNPYHTAHTGGNDIIKVPCSQDKIYLTDSEPYIEDAIARALVCRIKQYYNETDTWPSETTIYSMANNSYQNFTKNGYQIKINSQNGPDSTNFVIHYNTDCKGNSSPSNLSVFTPFYLNNHRKCVYSLSD